MKIAVIILNYFGYNDTVACLQSLELLQVNAGIEYNVLVIDNSCDSTEELNLISALIEAGISAKYLIPNDEPLAKFNVYISSDNLGFAEGNNMGMQICNQHYDIDYFWLLNNDTEVDANALNALITCVNAKPSVGIWGSALLEYDARNTIQNIGARLLPWVGITKLNYKGENYSTVTAEGFSSVLRCDYQSGASLFVSKAVISAVGGLDSHYFLYFEETDWQMRARKAGFSNDYCFESKVYHKGGVSTAAKPAKFYYYYNRSAMIFGKRYYTFPERVTGTLAVLGITMIKSKFSIIAILKGLRGLVHGLINKGINYGN